VASARPYRHNKAEFGGFLKLEFLAGSVKWNFWRVCWKLENFIFFEKRCGDDWGLQGNFYRNLEFLFFVEFLLVLRVGDP